MNGLLLFSCLFLFVCASFASDVQVPDDLQISYANPTTSEIPIEVILTDRKTVLEAYAQEYDLSEKEAKKVTHRLRKIFLADKEALHHVDIFIAALIPGIALDSYTVPNYSMSFTSGKNSNKVIFKKEGVQVTSKEEINSILTQDKLNREYKQEQKHSARQHNLKTIIDVLKGEITSEIQVKLQEAAEQGVPYVSLALHPKTIKKLLKKADNALTAVDIHTYFSLSHDEQIPDYENDSTDMVAWKNRFMNYLEITGTKDHNNSMHWGDGVGIYYSDALCPDISDVVFEGYTPPLTTHYNVLPSDNFNGYPTNLFHTKIITGILSTVASGADLWCRNEKFVYEYGGEHSYFNDPNHTVYHKVIPRSEEMPDIHIESYSLNIYASAQTNNITRDYYPMDKVFDDHAEEFNVPIFISAGNNKDDGPTGSDTNPGNDIISPAKAFNVITVGNYGVDNSTLVLSEDSSYNNPLLGGINAYQKPEISAPGTDFYGIYDNTVDFNITGTSFSTPFAAAITASIRTKVLADNDYDINLKLGPLLKAAVIALARDDVSVPSTEKYTENTKRYYVGEGGAEFSADTFDSARYPAMNFTSDNGRYCNSDYTFDIDGSNDVRVVTAWFNKVYNHEILAIPNSYTLEVLDTQGNVISFTKPDGTLANRADESNQGYQVINFSHESASNDTYRAKVCWWIADDNGRNNRVDFGFAVSTVPIVKESTFYPICSQDGKCVIVVL